MAVTAQTPYTQHVANGSTTLFAYTFQILTESQLNVYEDGVLTAISYTVSGVGETAGGAIVFDTPPLVGGIVSIERRTALERTTDYVDGGALVADTLDADMDSIVMMIQEYLATNTELVQRVTATGTNQAGAAAITALLVNVVSAASGAGVRLPAAVVGTTIRVFNKSGVSIIVYPTGSDALRFPGDNSLINISTNPYAYTFTCVEAGAYEVQA